MSFIDNIKEIPITDYAQRCGYTLVRKGRRYVSLAEHDSVMIDTERNCFWRNSVFKIGQKGGAGSIIDFAMEFQGLERDKALRELAVMYGIEGDKAPTQREYKPIPKTANVKRKREPGDLDLPPKAKNANEVFHYLNKVRKIDLSVIKYFIAKDMLYQDAKHNNCVFVTDKFGCVRSTGEKRFMLDLEGCDYNECFFFRPSKSATTLVVTESVIDVMSVMTQFAKEGKRYTDYSYLALSGVNKLESLFYHIEREKDINHIMLAFDNDEKGRMAFMSAVDGLGKISFEGDVEDYSAPSEKDWNAYIQATSDDTQKEEETKALLPDDSVSIKDMENFGYKFVPENEMLPLSTEKAVELFDKGATVYALYPDDTEGLVDSRSDIINSKGCMFGIERKDFEKFTAFELKQQIAEKEPNNFLDIQKVQEQENATSNDKQKEEEEMAQENENIPNTDIEFTLGEGEAATVDIKGNENFYRFFYVGEQDKEAEEFAQQTGWRKIWASDSHGMNGDTWIVYRNVADLPRYLRKYAQQQENATSHDKQKEEQPQRENVPSDDKQKGEQQKELVVEIDVLALLDEMDAWRRNHEHDAHQTYDYAMRFACASIAAKAGIKSREDWTQMLASDEQTQYFKYIHESLDERMERMIEHASGDTQRENELEKAQKNEEFPNLNQMPISEVATLDLWRNSGMFEAMLLHTTEQEKADLYRRYDEELARVNFKDISQPKIAILQLREGEENRDRRFTGLEQLEKLLHEQPNCANYELVYVGNAEAKAETEQERERLTNRLYAEFNANTLRPRNYYGHSLSVGDVIVIKNGFSEQHAYYVDNMGFTKLPDDFLSHEMSAKIRNDIDIKQECDLFNRIRKFEVENVVSVMDKASVDRHFQISTKYARVFELAERRGAIMDKATPEAEANNHIEFTLGEGEAATVDGADENAAPSEEEADNHIEVSSITEIDSETAAGMIADGGFEVYNKDSVLVDIGYIIDNSEQTYKASAENVEVFAKREEIALKIDDISSAYEFTPHEEGEPFHLDLMRFANNSYYYNWDGFQQGKNVYQNVMIALRENNLDVLHEYLDEVCNVENGTKFADMANEVIELLDSYADKYVQKELTDKENDPSPEEEQEELKRIVAEKSAPVPIDTTLPPKDQLKQRLENGVRSVLDSERFKNWLSTGGKLFYNNYSFRNAMLVWLQKPDASYVMGYEQWKDFGRNVAQGKEAAKVFVPIKANEKFKGGLFGTIKKALNENLSKNPSLSQANYRLGTSTYEFTLNRANGLMGLKINGAEKHIFNSDDEAKRFVERNVLGKVVTGFTQGNVFDVKDVVIPEYLWLKSGFTKEEIALDDNGKPVKNRRGETKIINTPERQARFQTSLDTHIVAQSAEKMQALLDACVAVSERKGVPVSFAAKTEDKTLAGGAKGYYSRQFSAEKPNGFIVIDKDLEVTEKCAVLLHEMSHSDLHKDLAALAEKMGEKNISREMREIQAEAAAYSVASTFGIETDTSSFNYLAVYARGFDLQDFQKSLEIIYKEAQSLTDDIKNELEIRGLNLDLTAKEKEKLTAETVRSFSEKYLDVAKEREADVQSALKELPSILKGVKNNSDLVDILRDQKLHLENQKNDIDVILSSVEKLNNAETREEQEAAIRDMRAAETRIMKSAFEFNELTERFVVVSQEAQQSAEQDFTKDPYAVLESLKQDYPQIAALTSAQIDYIAKSDYVRRELSKDLKKDPLSFVNKVADRANSIAQAASKNGTFVEIAFCEQWTDKPFFEKGDLCSPKYANSIMAESEKQTSVLKEEAEERGEYFPYSKCKFTVFTPNEKGGLLSVTEIIDIGDGEQKDLMDFLEQVHSADAKKISESFRNSLTLDDTNAKIAPAKEKQGELPAARSSVGGEEKTITMSEWKERFNAVKTSAEVPENANQNETVRTAESKTKREDWGD